MLDAGHGQGYHNLLADKYKEFSIPDGNNPYALPEIVDPPLTEKGRQQCKAQRMGSSAAQCMLLACRPFSLKQ